MAQVCVPLSACGGLEIDGRSYEAKKGFVDVPDHLVSRVVRRGGCFLPARPARSAGFVCEVCGFHALIRTCGRCGGRCHRQGETDA